MAFLFPDTYEIGMSHLGSRILYEAVNRRPDMLMERAYAPQVDMEAILRDRGLPLFSWESRRPIADFDVVGFTLQYELSYTNILNMLDLSGIPLRAAKRDGFPIIIAGGPCAFNPEPLADFIDIFLIGEGEEQLPELLDLVKRVRAAGGSKQDVLHAAAQQGDLYVPAAYAVQKTETGRISAIDPLWSGAPKTIVKRIVPDFDQAAFPIRGLLPNTRIVHDRLMLEIMRGCCRGCRFCQAGIIYRPVREKRLETLVEQARAGVAATGYDEIGLVSLSSADYTEIYPLATQLLRNHRADCVGISLPSLRADAFSVDLADQVQQVRKSGLTFAPEAGTQRLRDSINKGIEEAQIYEAAAAAFSQGWTSVKLYFMIGLPGETDEDIAGIAAICRGIIRCYKENKPALGSRKPLRIALGVASFVPKSHTPFQWYGQNSAAELRRKQAFLREQIKPMRMVTLSTHNIAESQLEAAFARGGRELGQVLELAWRHGCRFDGWSEHFNEAAWQAAFAEAGYTVEDFAMRAFAKEEVLPWDHIATGVNKAWLWREKERAEAALVTPDCREGKCSGCGVCQNLDCPNVLQSAWKGSKGANLSD